MKRTTISISMKLRNELKEVKTALEQVIGPN